MRRIDLFEATMQGWARLDAAQRSASGFSKRA
ncbi:hypothetical protein Bra1253DRAFT_00102 [Bradyrhizobium sp. WSM1253]|nr:hypothetical protein Bra1253DRAFT_00102 [Bradyrhizobium sp. WSM1253]